MRKTSQDGGDTTSITSSIENEVKKSTAGIAKITRSSIKKRVQGLSHESDDGVIEPLLQKDKERTEFPSQSAKFSLTKTKTDTANIKMDDKDKLLPDNKVEKLPLASFSGVSQNLTNGTKEGYKSYSCTASAIHNHNNTNIFSNSDTMKNSVASKNPILVEIDGNKQGGYSSGPLIFTTAKIHTDGKTMQMEPVQVTPVPILSTVEGSVIKTSSEVINQKVKLETSGKGIDVKKASEEINKGDVNLKTSTGNCSKQEPSFTRTTDALALSLPKDSSVDKKGVGNAFNSKLPNLYTCAVKIGDSNVITTMAPKIMTPITSMQADRNTSDKLSLVTKDVPKVQVSDKESIIGVKQEIDFNKNFQLPTCSTLPMINSKFVKDVTDKDKKDSSIKQLQRQTNTVEDIHSSTDTKNSKIIHDTKPTVTEKNPSTFKTHIVSDDNDSKNEISKIPGIMHASTSSKLSLTMTKDKILKPVPTTVIVTKTHPSIDEFTTASSTTMSTKISTVIPNTTHTTTATKKPNIKPTTITDSVIGKYTPSTTVVVTPLSSISTISVDPKSRVSTKMESVNNKPTTKSESVSTSGEMLSGKTALTTSKLKTTSASSMTPLIGSVPKSTAVSTTTSSNNIVKLNTVIPNKLNTTKDQVTGTNSKIESPMSSSATTGSSTKGSTTKPSITMVSKMPQNISSSKTPVTSTKLTETKTINANKNSATSAASSKTTQESNVGKTCDSQGVSTKATIKPTSTIVSPATVVTTTSQKSSTINKSIDLRSNEHKKEKSK